MSSTVLSIAATGMAAQSLNVEVIANNIANINTVGFRGSRAEFTDLIYQPERLPGVSSRGQDAAVPEGAMVGLGVRTAAVRNLQIQGTLNSTGQSARSRDQRPGLVSGDGAGWNAALYPRGRFFDQSERPDRHAGRLYRQPGNGRADKCAEREHQSDWRRQRHARRADAAAADRPVVGREFRQ